MSAEVNVFDVLVERGFVAQVTEEALLREALAEPISCYVGFDPTADSLHVGSLVPIFALAHMQRHGHRPLVLVGGGTGMVGDPSGKTEMRQMLSLDQIRKNAEALRQQLSSLIDFSEQRALSLNNADWLMDLHYIDFLREIGRHFSVNRMLTAESYRLRLETGLNFIEFNYMLLQAYDFLYLCEHYDCRLQMGGNDQWGNIVAGIDLIRRKNGKQAFGLTFPLMVTAAGTKMGKTAEGAVWLSAQRTPPYEFYQYWVNVDDRDVGRFLKLYTFLPLTEIAAIDSLEGQDLNVCKSILAYEVTRLIHGQDAARTAHQAAGGAFGQRVIASELLPSSTVPRQGEAIKEEIPTVVVELARLKQGVPLYALLAEVGLCASRSAARRLIQQGGAYVNDARVDSDDALVTCDDGIDGQVLLRAGKKKVHRLEIRG